ncbi:acetoacetate decarboxylase family protein [Streptomyces sp. NPDC002589]|uniref:hypothetical protein n=1 Tax=Streptomyces sp. NPDC002589 TaxID=3154420 RepID=UPI0033210428
MPAGRRAVRRTARVRYGARTEREIATTRTASARRPAIWSTGVVAVWETGPDAIAAVLPPPLKPTGSPLVMTQERALTGGREVFGEPEKLGEVTTDFCFKFLPAVDRSGFETDPVLVHCVRHEKVRRLERITGEVVPREEPAAMPGGNAARVYGFDLARLDPIAAKVGPT